VLGRSQSDRPVRRSSGADGLPSKYLGKLEWLVAFGLGVGEVGGYFLVEVMGQLSRPAKFVLMSAVDLNSSWRRGAVGRPEPKTVCLVYRQSLANALREI